jgi:hypothetical protein
MKRADAFPSRFWKAADLKDGPVTLTIEHTNYEAIKENAGESKEKLVAYFKSQKKSLVLNLTNFESIAGFCGEDSDDWAGKRITLFADTTTMGGKRVDCVRVRRPSATKTKPTSLGFDDQAEDPGAGLDG